MRGGDDDGSCDAGHERSARDAASTELPDAREHVSPSFGGPGSRLMYAPRGIGGAPCRAALSIPLGVPATSMHLLFAHRQWRAGMLLADMAVSVLPLEGRYVLELGAGTGLPSIAAALSTAAARVVVTDYDDADMVRTMRANMRDAIAANGHAAATPYSVLGHTWGQHVDDVLDVLPCVRGQSTRYDVVLLADCVWERFSHDALLRTIAHVLARTPDARVYMVAGLHTGRATLVHFFRRALAAGLCLVPVPGGACWPACDAPGPVGDDLAGREHILELEVGGTLAEMPASSAEACASEAAPAPRWGGGADRVAGLTGRRRAFVLSRGAADGADDEPIAERNRWLTVSCMAWAAAARVPM